MCQKSACMYDDNVCICVFISTLLECMCCGRTQSSVSVKSADGNATGGNARQERAVIVVAQNVPLE